ncbi:MAG: MerR family transcriptional regulator [Devosia sp.]|nr:MerR family transcriptional regulator [Devosia sp.]
MRTLHHYDEIGLLEPAFSGENGYRYYEEEELLRLQQILIFRELDIPLAEIAALLDAPDFNRLEVLHVQRSRLKKQARHYVRLVRTIDRTIARLKGTYSMPNADLYSGVVSPEKQAEYEAWLIQRFGDSVASEIGDGHVIVAAPGTEPMQRRMAELEVIELGLAEGLRLGIPPQAASLAPLLERHCLWVETAWARKPTPEEYAGLAETYRAHPDFIKRYEGIAPGFTAYLATAMQNWAQRQA